MKNYLKFKPMFDEQEFVAIFRKTDYENGVYFLYTKKNGKIQMIIP